MLSSQYLKKDIVLIFLVKLYFLPVVRVVFGPVKLTMSHWVNLHLTFFFLENMLTTPEYFFIFNKSLI
jgi:hypothetical protein